MVVVLGRVRRRLGLVTMEDVLEEIVGEIVDEYDPAHVEGVRELGPGVCEALGRVHIDEINERLGLGLPEDADYDTIGGFVFNELGHIPTTGEDLVWQNVPHHGPGCHAAADRTRADRGPRRGGLAGNLELDENVLGSPFASGFWSARAERSGWSPAFEAEFPGGLRLKPGLQRFASAGEQ